MSTTPTAPFGSHPDIFHPGTAGYHDSRAAWALTADLRPTAVWIAHDVRQVQSALEYARNHGLKVATQTTGHLGQALPPLAGALLLKPMLHHGEVEVDPVARTARVMSGAVWRDVVSAVAPHGLAAMHGSAPSVGVVGYLLGGGLSFYARGHGLAANHVRAFEVVTPDGVFRRVDAHHHPDLFYALRGGGGGYAIVCAVEIDLLPYAEVTGGALFFPAQSAGKVLRAWLDWTEAAPDAITTTLRVMRLPDLPEVPEPLRGVATLSVHAVSLDGPAPATQLERRLTGVADPLFGGFGPMPSAGVLKLHAAPEDPLPTIGDGILLGDLDEEAVETFLHINGPESPLMLGELRQLGGVLTDRPSNSGARGHLEGRFLLVGIGICGAPAAPDELDAYVSSFLAAMQPWATGTRLSPFAERWRTLETCLPEDALARVRDTRLTYDPEEMLIAPQLPTGLAR